MNHDPFLVPAWFLYLVPFILLAATIGSLTFTLSYGLKSPWRSSTLGRMTFTKSLALSSVLLLNTVQFFIGPFPGILLLMVCVNFFLVGAIWFQTITLLRAQMGKLKVERQEKWDNREGEDSTHVGSTT